MQASFLKENNLGRVLPRKTFLNTGLIVLIAVLDYAAMGVVYTAMTFLFLASQDNLLTPFSTTQRFVLLSILFALAPLAQFFSAPRFGRLSDHWGRKNTLLITLTGGSFSLLVTGLALSFHSLGLLLLSRIMTGLFAGNISVAQASLSDAETEKRKAWRFNFLEIGIGLGLIIGPLLGAKLIHSNAISWFSYATPFYVLAILNFIYIVFFAFLFKETLAKKITEKFYRLPLRKIILRKDLRGLFLIFTLAMLGYSFYLQFFVVFLKQSAGFSIAQVGNLFSVVGIVYVLYQLLIAYPLLKYVDSKKLIKPSLFFFGVFILLMAGSRTEFWIYLFRFSYMLAIVLFLPSFNGLLANQAGEKIQGQIFGIISAIYALDTLIVAATGGYIASLNPALPIILGGIFILLAWVFLLKNKY